jgi:hypothetical protein
LWIERMRTLRTASLLPALADYPVCWAITEASARRLVWLSLLLAGFALRLPLLDRFPLREDEALYSFWALHFARIDPLFLQVWPDKPPLFLWAQAVMLELFGPSQAAARWLNLALSTLTIPVVGAIAQVLWGRRSASLAALAYCLNPFAISFAATAFTDPLMVLAGMLALLAALRQRPLPAGLCLAAAIMTKQQGLLYAPLIIAVIPWGVRSGAYQIQNPEYRIRSGDHLRTPHFQLPTLYLWLIAGLALVCLPILYWDSLRWAVAPSPWDLGVRNYGALAIALIDEWGTRLRGWGSLAWFLTANDWLWMVLLLLAVFVVGQEIHAAKAKTKARTGGTISSQRRRLLPAMLVFWSLGFFALHVTTTVQIWDRYLLPLAPMATLALAGLLSPWLETATPVRLAAILLAGLIFLTPPAIQAAHGRYPIGGDHGEYTGLTEALAWLRSERLGKIALYHQKLGWHYRYYLFDEIERGHVELRWFPSAVYLADNASKAAQRTRLLIQPDWAPVRNLAQQLAVRNLALVERQRFGHFTVYEFKERSAPFCAWCVCRSGPTLPMLTPNRYPDMICRSQTD